MAKAELTQFMGFVLWQFLKPVPGWNRFSSPARLLAVLADYG
jgi:hypothetical protein